MRTINRYILTLAAFAVSLTAGAQALPFVAVDYNPASLAKGGATYADASSVAHAAFTSPAAAAFYNGNLDVSAGYTMWQPTNVSTNVISAAGTYKVGDKFGISAGFSYGTNQPYDVTDDLGNVKGSFNPSQMHLGAGFAWRFLENVSVGANVGYATSSLAEGTSYGTVVADVQAMAVFGGFRASVGVSDLGGSITSASGATYALPSAARLGVGYALGTEKHVVDLSADAAYHFNGGAAAAVGASYTFNDLLSVRAGYRYGGNTVVPSYASAGLGLKLFGVQLNFAYLLGSDVLANTMCVSLGYAF